MDLKIHSSDDPPPREWLDAAAELLGRAGRRGILRIQGISMIPTIRPGSTLEVEFRFDRVRIGDVLLFRQSGELVAHRFLARVRSKTAGPCLRTRGDGVSNLDPPLLDGSLVGKVTAVEREDGWRSLAGLRARTYSVLLALHDHFWAAVVLVARRADAGLSRAGLPAPCERISIRCDRLGMRLADSLLFRLCHAPIDPPELNGAASGS